MRFKPFAVPVIGFAMLGAAYFFCYVYAVPLPDNALHNVQSVYISDEWTGYSEWSPNGCDVELTHKDGAWSGPVTLFAMHQVQQNGLWHEVKQKKTVQTSVPDAVMQKVFHLVQTAPLRRGPYKPVLTHTDDHPHILIEFRRPKDWVTFATDSNTPNHVPWGVSFQSKNDTTQSDAPYTALLLLRPYLHKDEFDKLKQQAVKPR